MPTLLLGFITAFALTYALIPLIITVVRERRLYDRPNERSSHEEPTPSLGGIGIFAGTVCGIVLWTPVGSFSMLQYILAAFVLIFLIGILDDLLPISPGKKLGAQFFVAIILAYKAGIRLPSLYGLLGIYELPGPASFILTIVVIVAIINAFNLIDGINGLAGSVGFLTCVVFGSCFHFLGVPALAVVSFSLAGATLAFLRYNFTPAKIFMGDTGSLLIGTVCAILAIKFIETNHIQSPETPYVFNSAPAMALAVLFLPLFDTISVFMRRILRGRSPFSPDKTHTHHQLLNLGLSHTSTTVVLIGVNLLFIIAVFGFHNLALSMVLLLEFVMALAFSMLLFLMPRLNVQGKK